MEECHKKKHTSENDVIGYSFETYGDCLKALELARSMPMPDACSPVYARFGLPSVWEAERALAEFYHARWCVLFPSGMASIEAALSVARHYVKADTITFVGQMYPGTVSYAKHILQDMRNLPVRFVSSPVELGLLPLGREIIFTESLTNPLLQKAPIELLVGRSGAFVVVDNTMITALGANPLQQGAGLVVESVGKYISGHNALMAGAIWGNDEKLCLAVRDYQRRTGSIMAAQSARLLQQHIKTFKIRVEKQCANAASLARHLKLMGTFKDVFHPAVLEGDGYTHDSMAPSICLCLLGTDTSTAQECADIFINALKPEICFSTSLGSTTTSIMNVSTYIHGRKDEDEYIRINVGIEDINYLVKIFDRANEFIGGKK